MSEDIGKELMMLGGTLAGFIAAAEAVRLFELKGNVVSAEAARLRLGELARM